MSKKVQELIKGLKLMQKYCVLHSGASNDCGKCKYFGICSVLENDFLPDEWDLPPVEEEEAHND